ncbi:uncharacterized [Tachysurus ichikawai]
MCRETFCVQRASVWKAGERRAGDERVMKMPSDTEAEQQAEQKSGVLTSSHHKRTERTEPPEHPTWPTCVSEVKR